MKGLKFTPERKRLIIQGEWMRLGGESIALIDVPGTFSLEAKDKAEEVTVKMLEKEKNAVVVCIAVGYSLILDWVVAVVIY